MCSFSFCIALGLLMVTTGVNYIKFSLIYEETMDDKGDVNISKALRIFFIGVLASQSLVIPTGGC